MENDAPINCTSKWRMFSLRRDISRQTREGLRQDVVQGLPGPKALLELLGLVGEGMIGERSQA